MGAAEHRVRLPGRYRVIRHVANGGMAAVWLAEDELLGRQVAVKVLSPAFAADEVAARRFEREARAAARLSDHPHVVTIFDFGHHEGHPFIVMEHFAGGTVAARVRAQAPIPREVASRWLREAASALDAAHAAGVVHRDVKPHNFLLDAEDRLAVADFGIATLAAETALTQAGLVLGTAAYLSPEQRAGRPATPASDRYALAVVARELLPDAPAEVIARGLAEDPAQRPPSGAALVDELERVLSGAKTAPQRTHPARELPDRRTPATPADDRRRRAFPRLLALGALLAGGAVAIGIATTGGDGSGGRSADATRPNTTSTAESRPAQKSKPATTPTTQAAPAPKPSAPASSPRELNDLGFAKLPGDPAGAIPLLQQSVEGFRSQGDTGDINYAYALFNLGNALRLAGRPAEAVPFLEERLRVSNFKRGIVKKELKLAQKQAGQGDDD